MKRVGSTKGNSIFLSSSKVETFFSFHSLRFSFRLSLFNYLTLSTRGKKRQNMQKTILASRVGVPLAKAQARSKVAPSSAAAPARILGATTPANKASLGKFFARFDPPALELLSLLVPFHQIHARADLFCSELLCDRKRPELSKKGR